MVLQDGGGNERAIENMAGIFIVAVFEGDALKLIDFGG